MSSATAKVSSVAWQQSPERHSSGMQCMAPELLMPNTKLVRLSLRSENLKLALHGVLR